MNNIEIIGSKENQKIKLISSLKLRKNREKHRLVMIEGLRAVKQILDDGINVKMLAFSEAEINSDQEYREIYEKHLEVSCVVRASLFSQITDTVNTQGIVALVDMPSHDLKAILSGERMRVVIFDRIQDPGNAGTLIRTADAAGFDAVLYTKGTVDLFSPKVNRSAMGLNLSVPVAEIDLADIDYMKAQGFAIYATALDDYSVLYDSVRFDDRTAIILGNEANGISEELLSVSDEKLYIPIFGKAESLNVGIAGAIIMYESLKKQ
ncbi:MAG: RNA methyltransferase [Proteocatella sp.]|nr:RNA methyltransferase [Proteocatella sp.]MBP7908140.1 RNA methyltransferase [Proteocatella sp.]